MWDAVRPLDNQVSAAVAGGAADGGDPAGRARRAVAAAAARAGGAGRPPIGEVTERFARPVAAVRDGLPGWLLGAEARPTPSARRGCRTPACPRTWPPRSRRRRCCRRRSTSPSSPSGPAPRSRWPARCSSAWPSGWAWCRCASWSSRCPATAAGTRWPGRRLRDDLAAEQAALTADVLALRRRTTDRAPAAGRGVGGGAGTAPSSGRRPSWPTSRRATGRSWPSCWSPSAPCAACAAAA